MAQTNELNTTTRDVVISRLYNAPAELVFNVWADVEHLERWYAPNGCTIRFVHLDFHVGGTFHSCITTPDGYECWCVGTYLEIAAPHRIVYTLANADEQGNKRQPAELGMDADWPGETIVTITFENDNGKTLLTLHQTAPEAIAKRTGAHTGWVQMLDNLAAELPPVS